MSNDYKSKDVQLLFSVSDETVRTWAKQFESFLSPLANPGTGRHRVFNYDDLSVFALVSEMKGKGMTYADIEAALGNDQRGDVPDIPTDLDVLQTTIQLDDASQRIIELRETMQRQHDEIIRLKTLLGEREKQLESSRVDRERFEKLYEEIGRLKALLEIERQKNTKEQSSDENG